MSMLIKREDSKAGIVNPEDPNNGILIIRDEDSQDASAIESSQIEALDYSDASTSDVQTQRDSVPVEANVVVASTETEQAEAGETGHVDEEQETAAANAAEAAASGWIQANRPKKRKANGKYGEEEEEETEEDHEVMITTSTKDQKRLVEAYILSFKSVAIKLITITHLEKSMIIIPMSFLLSFTDAFKPTYR